MALKKCRECNKEVSSQAKVCPNCGVSKPVKGISFFTGLIVIGFVLYMIGVIASNEPGQQKQAQVKVKVDEAQKLRETAALRAQEIKNRKRLCQDFKVLDQLMGSVISRVEKGNQKIYVNRSWYGLLVNEKEGLTKYIYECYSGQNSVSILDAFSGAKIAKYNVFGFEVLAQ